MRYRHARVQERSGKTDISITISKINCRQVYRFVIKFPKRKKRRVIHSRRQDQELSRCFTTNPFIRIPETTPFPLPDRI
jgi:hypothetical protein